MCIYSRSGPGGIGKTRLSLQAAAELVEDFPDGVYFVDLAPIRETTLVVSTIAPVLEVREDPRRTRRSLAWDAKGIKQDVERVLFV